MVRKDFSLIFENSFANKNIDWVNLNLKNNKYIIDLKDIELLDKDNFSNNQLDKDIKIWTKISPDNYKALFKKSIVREIAMGIVIDLTFYKSLKDLEIIKKVFKLFNSKNIILEITSLDQINELHLYSKMISGIIAKGSDSYGYISELTTSMLVQAALKKTKLPVYAKGGIGFNTVASYYQINCSGVIFDIQMSHLDAISLPAESLNFLSSHASSDTVVLGASLGIPFRISTRSSKKEVDLLKKTELKIFLSENSNETKQKEFKNEIQKYIGDFSNLSIDSKIYPASQDLFLINQFKKYQNIERITWAINNSIETGLSLLEKEFPIKKDNSFCKLLKSKLPLIQGPMAHVSDSVEFAEIVSKKGALPVFAFGGKRLIDINILKKQIIQCKNKFQYGIGIIGFDPEMDEEETFKIISELNPLLVIIAGAKIRQIEYFEKKGIHAFIHTPNKESFEYFLSSGAKKFIFEGTEAGGHVGSLSLMVIIESILDTIKSGKYDDKLKDITMVFAGGIHDDISSLMLNSAIVTLIGKGINTGFQIGTAYLATQEAEKCGIITKEYINSIIQHDTTTVVGESVNVPLRLIPNNFCNEIYSLEKRCNYEIADFEERKKIIHNSKRGKLFLASKGLKICFDEDENDSSLTKVDGEELLNEGGFTVGQNIAFLNSLSTIDDVHENIVFKSQKKLFKQKKDEIPIDIMEISDNETNIAIVGMGCIFPDSKNINDYWYNILNYHCAIKEVPLERWNRFLYFDPNKDAEDKSYAKIAAFIDDYQPDPFKYNIVPKSAGSIDYVQFMFLDAIEEALVDSGYDFRDFNRDKTAVFVGNSMSGEMKDENNFRVKMVELLAFMDEISEFNGLPANTKHIIKKAIETKYKTETSKITEDGLAGVLPCVIAGRAANVFNLRGGNFAIDAACASSFAALDVSINYLKSKQMDMVITGGSDRLLNESDFVYFSKAGALGARGSFPFEKRAEGFVQGEGTGVVILKRLEDAIRDNDKIYAVIKGVGFSSDGKGRGITAPNSNGQALAIKRCYQNTGFTPETIGFMEAHGTGTKVGDVSEITALDNIWQQFTNKKNNCPIGSVKSNIGHLKSSAGIASLIKTALALHYKILPGNTNFQTPNPNIDLKQSSFYVNTKNRIWKEGKYPRRAGVEGFAFGGINYHLALEEYNKTTIFPDKMQQTLENALLPFQSEVLILGGDTKEEVLALIREIKENVLYIEYEKFSNFVFSCNLKFSKCNTIISIVVADQYDVIKKLDIILNEFSQNPELCCINNEMLGIYYNNKVKISPEEIGFVFSGQGSQYLNMGKSVIDSLPQAKKLFDQADEIFQNMQQHSIKDVMFYDYWNEKSENDHINNLNNTEFTQPAVAILSLIYLNLFRELGITQQISVGHSLGEYSALSSSGYFDFDSIIKIVIERAKETANLNNSEGQGIMASIGADQLQIEEFLKDIDDYVIISNLNSPKQTVISGEKKGVQKVVEIAKQKGLFAKIIPVSNAFHSEKLKSFVPILKDIINKHSHKAQATAQVMSNTSGDFYPLNSNNLNNEVAEILANHIAKPVNFIDNIKKMYESGIKLFIEIGPNSYLKSFIDDILEDNEFYSISVDNKNRDSLLQFHNTLALLTSLGIQLNWEKFYEFRNLNKEDVNNWISKIKTNRSKIQKNQENHDNLPLTTNHEKHSFAFFDQNILNNNLFNQYIAERDIFIKDLIKHDFFHYEQDSILSGGHTLKLNKTELIDNNTRPENNNDNNNDNNNFKALPENLIPQHPVNNTKYTKKEIENKIKGIINDLTGYPINMLESTLNLEADFGIDSLKQLNIFSELVKEYSMDAVDFENENIDRTIQGIARFIYQKINSDKTDTVKEPAVGQNVQIINQQANANLLSDNADPGNDKIENEVKEIIKSVTGYPMAMLENSSILNYEIGIDEFKIKELISLMDKKFLLAFSYLQDNQNISIQSIIDYIKNKGNKSPQLDTRQLDSSNINTNCFRYTYQSMDSSIDIDKEETNSLIINDGIYLILADSSTIWLLLKNELEKKGIKTVILFDKEDESVYQEHKASNMFLVDMNNEESIVENLTKIQASCNHINISMLISLFTLRDLTADFLNKPVEFNNELEKISIGHFNLIKNLLIKNPKIRILTTTQLNGYMGLKNIPSGPQTSTIPALLKTAKLEYPEMKIKNIDFDFKDESSIIFSNIWNELKNSNEATEVGYDKYIRKEFKTVDSDRFEKNVKQLTLSKNSTVIAFGGSGGVTSRICKEIANQFQSKIYIVGRTKYIVENENLSLTHQEYFKQLVHESEKTNKKINLKDIQEKVNQFKRLQSIKNCIDTLKSYGSECYYFNVSTEKSDDLDEFFKNINNQNNQIDLIINGVGVLDDKLIENMSIEKFKMIFKNKVDSFLNISKSSLPYKPKMVVNFSSIAGRYGNKGQVNYGMGNEFLTKMAGFLNYQCKQNGLLTQFKTIIWGVWLQLGMTDNVDLINYMKKEATGFIKPENGVDFFLNEILYGQESEVGYYGNFNNEFYFKSITNSLNNNRLVLGDITYIEPGKRIINKKKFDLKKEIFLKDHVIFNKNIIPGCYILEIFAGISKILFPDLNFVEFRNIEFLIPVYANSNMEYEVEAVVEKESSKQKHLLISMYSYFENGKLGIKRKQDHYKANIILGEQSSVDWTEQSFNLNNYYKSIPSEKLYEGNLMTIDGPIFRNVEKLFFLNENLCVAAISKEKASLYSKGNDYQSTAGSFLLRDAALQTAGIWSSFFCKTTCIPLKINNIKYYQDNDISNEFYCHVDNVNNQKSTITSDIKIFNEEGNIVESITGFQAHKLNDSIDLSEEIVKEINEFMALPEKV